MQEFIVTVKITTHNLRDDASERDVWDVVSELLQQAKDFQAVIDDVTEKQ